MLVVRVVWVGPAVWAVLPVPVASVFAGASPPARSRALMGHDCNGPGGDPCLFVRGFGGLFPQKDKGFQGLSCQ